MYHNVFVGRYWLIHQELRSLRDGLGQTTFEEQIPHRELKLEPEMEPGKSQKALLVLMGFQGLRVS